MSEINLESRVGLLGQPISEVLCHILGFEPEWVLAEPTPQDKRIGDFPGIWAKQWQPPADIRSLAARLQNNPPALEEVRCFFDAGTMVLLARGERTLVAWIVRADRRSQSNQPIIEWCQQHLRMDVDSTDLVGLTVRFRDVLIQKDWHRYGLASFADLAKHTLRVAEFWKGTRVVHWHLES